MIHSARWRTAEESDILYKKKGDNYHRIWRAGGTSLQGHVKATLPEMEQILGEPNEMGDKSSHEWLVVSDSIPLLGVTVYNYKQTRDYCDDKDYAGNYIFPSRSTWAARHKTRHYDWHIGALSKDIAASAMRFLERELTKLREED